VGFRLKKAKKKLAIILNCAILNPVSERNNNEINKMNNENMIDRIDTEHATLREQIQSTVLVSCCGCNEELHISREAANEWTDTDWFMCHECE
jgi:hypothetical protein